MIVTVTLNTGIDRTLFVPSFQMNSTLRASRVAVGLGGKGADASWILGELGIPSLALGFAAGVTGQQVEAMLRARGVTTDFVWTAGETRVNTVIICADGSGQATITAESLLVTPADVEALLARFRAALARSQAGAASCVVIGGSVPRGVEASIYTQMVAEGRAAGVPVALDSSGAALKAGLAGGPTVVKPNRVELEELTGKSAATLPEVYQAASQLQADCGAAVVVTLGGLGGVAALPGRAYFIPPLPVEAVSTAGAGDGVLAGLAAALSRGEPLEAGLRLGFAAASAVLLTPATADCRREDVLRLLDQVALIPYPPGAQAQLSASQVERVGP